MLIANAWAQSSGASPEPNIFVQLAPFLLIILIMYFLLFRPQQQKIKRHREMIAAVKVGDSITTAGGLVARVTRVIDDSYIAVQVADGIEVHLARNMIADVINDQNLSFLRFKSEKSAAAKSRSRGRAASRRGGAAAASASEQENDLGDNHAQEQSGAAEAAEDNAGSGSSGDKS